MANVASIETAPATFGVHSRIIERALRPSRAGCSTIF